MNYSSLTRVTGLILVIGASTFSYSVAQELPLAKLSAEAAADLPLSELQEDLVPKSSWHRHFSEKDTYFDLEYLLWGLEGAPVPRLVTSNPAGTPLANIGNPNDPSTQTALGDHRIGDWAQSGIRVRYGKMISSGRFSRWELGGLFLFDRTESLSIGTTSHGDILSRPFFNTQTGQPDAQIFSLSGVVEGTFTSEYSRRLLSIDPTLLFCITGNHFSAWEGVVGYRFLRYEDELYMSERLQLEPGGLIAPGTEIFVEDSIRVRNDYHLLPLGLNYSRVNGSWHVNVRGTMSIGLARQTANLWGRTTNSVGGNVVSVADGGFAVLSSNAGRYSQTKFAWVPELNFTVRRHLRKGLSLQAGYTLLYLNQVARAPAHFSTDINPDLFPPAVGTGNDPAFRFVSNGEWIHGLNAGLQWNY